MYFPIRCWLPLMILLLAGCAQSLPPREDFAMASKIIRENNERLGKEGIECKFVVEKFPGSVRTIASVFLVSDRRFDSVPEARRFFCEFFDSYVRPFNEARQLRPYLYRFPVDSRMLLLILCFCEKDGERVRRPPNFAWVRCEDGDLHYTQYDPQAGGYVDVYKEPLDKARRIVSEEKCHMMASGGVSHLARQTVSSHEPHVHIQH